MAAPPSKAWICGRSFAKIEGSNPAGCMDMCVSLVSVVCSQVQISATGPIPHPEKSYRVWCVSLLPDVAIILPTYNEEAERGQTRKERKKERKKDDINY